MLDLASELSGRGVFVTGADGFVGSHLIDTLVEHDAEVHAFTRASSTSGLKNIDHQKEDVTIHWGNLCDITSVRNALEDLEEYSEVLVFHLAAQAHVGESWDRPYETIETNVNGTLNLLESIVNLDIDIEKFDTAGTSEEYGNVDPEKEDANVTNDKGHLVLSERSPVNPTSVYATSKLAADFLTMNYHDAYGLPGVTTRMFNNYGPRQNPRYITGTIISQALERDRIELGNLQPKRDMCYVEDGVRGHLHVAIEGTPGERYVYGYGENISMREWTNLILEIGSAKGYWDNPEVVQRDDRFRPGNSDVEELLVNYGKLHEETGWVPQTTWREGLGRTIDWYANNKGKWYNRVDWH